VNENLTPHAGFPEIPDMIGDAFGGLRLVWFRREKVPDAVRHLDEMVNVHGRLLFRDDAVQKPVSLLEQFLLDHARRTSHNLFRSTPSVRGRTKSTKREKEVLMRFMRRLVGLAIVLLLAVCQQFVSQTPAQPPGAAAQTTAPRGAAAQTPVERGRYFVTIMGCNDCHTPKIGGADLDAKRLLSGHPANEKLTPVPAGLIAPDKWGALTNNHLTAWVGPWGVSFAPNLTPDKATGIGSWTPEMFIAALRTGKHRGEAKGRAILPPMPWVMYKDMQESDLRAMFAYLQSLPPINNMAPLPLPPDKIPR
jgi:hypothetical protein